MFEIIRDVRCQAAGILGKRGDVRGTTALIALCGSKDGLVRNEAVQALGMLADERDSSIFHSPNEVRPYADSAALQATNQVIPEVLSCLISVCTNTNEVSYVRVSATIALGYIGEARPPVINALVLLYQDQDEKVRCSAMQALGRLGHASEEVLDGLYQMLETGDGTNGDWLGLMASVVALRTHKVEAWIQAQDA